MDPGRATLTVTRDYGSELVLEATAEDPAASETVARLLDREAEIETSYGGNFVDSIDGVSGRSAGGGREDWFFYVNGEWSPVGAGETPVRAGDRIWWDHRLWTGAYEVPAVVGSFPAPFTGTIDGERPPTEVVCFDVETACASVAGRLRDAGVEEVRERAGSGGGAEPRDMLRILVGSWNEVRDDATAAMLEEGPASSGVYARPVRCAGGFGLELLDGRARSLASLADAGWIAATVRGEEPPTWIVSGSGPERVADAAASLEATQLERRYALAVAPTGTLSLPAASELAATTERECG